MSVLHVDTGSHWRGGQRQVFYLARGLQERKIKTAVVCREDSVLDTRLRQAGIPVFNLPLTGEYDLYSAFRMSRYYRRGNFPLLHAHTSHAHGIGIAAGVFHKAIRLVVTRRSTGTPSGNPLNRYKYQVPAEIISISRAVRYDLQDLGLLGKDLPVVYSGIEIPERDERGGTPELIQDLPPEIHVIGTAGRFTPEKDMFTFIQSAVMLLKKRQDIAFIALGEGPQRNSLLNLVEQTGYRNRIYLPGFRDNVQDYISHMDIYVNTSTVEALGTSVLDAMAYGVPVVATEVGGIPEIIEREETGLLAYPGDAEDIAQQISHLLEHPDQRKSMGEKARARSERFTIERMVEGNITVYEKLLKGNEESGDD